MQVWRRIPLSLVAMMSLTGPLLTSCALPDAPPLDYQCPHDLRFTARLYRDMAMLDGMSGHAVLARQAPQASDAPAGDAGGKSAPLRYADDSVRAQFGLGEQGRLARLDYTDIPEPVYCARIAPPGAPVTPPYAINRDGPRPPPLSPNPDAPVITNIRTGDGADTRLN